METVDDPVGQKYPAGSQVKAGSPDALWVKVCDDGIGITPWQRR
jgi:hypothetical protein